MTGRPPIDPLSLLSRFAREKRISLRDPNLRERFLGQIGSDIDTALEHDALLHGQRTQNMFEALIVSLGKYKLLKLEDLGLVHPSVKFTAPDFRLVLEDGTQWLVEVKNVYSNNAKDQRLALRQSDVRRLVQYSDTVGVPLKWAVYWSRWRIWTLIDTQRLVADGQKSIVSMLDAVRFNELGRIGDRTVGTLPSLSLRFVADAGKPRSISTIGEAVFTVGAVKFFCGQNEIIKPLEQEIAWIFMRYGDWQCSDPKAVVVENELQAIEFVWTPQYRANPGERFEIIGTLSTVFARYYADMTVSDGEVVQTEASLVPDWLKPLSRKEHQSEALPLWLFELAVSDA